MRKELEEQHEKEHGPEVNRISVNPTLLLCHFKGGRGLVSESEQALSLSLFSRDVSRGMKKSEKGKEKGWKHGSVE